MSKYIIIYYNNLYLKEVLFKKIIDYLCINSTWELLIISKKKKILNCNYKIFQSINEIFKKYTGKFLILYKVIYLKNLKEIENITDNLKIYKDNKIIGKLINTRNGCYLNYHFKGFIYFIFNNNSLSHLSKLIQLNINKSLINKRVNIIDIHNTYISIDSKIEKNTTIYPYTFIDCSKIKSSSSIGPFANIKKNSVIGSNVRVGNFVEIKNSIIDDNTKIAHHAYIGDAIIGDNCNIGCGVITCNYDGKNKYKTLIGSRVFIGSNVNLIAPISIEDDAYIASGSTIYENVPKKTLSICRSYQVNKKGYSVKYPYYLKFYAS